jgi:hypothetical protein
MRKWRALGPQWGIALVVAVVILLVAVLALSIGSTGANGPTGANGANGTNGNNGPTGQVGPLGKFVPLDEKSSRIFVSVASYRDKLCSSTIESLYANARHPERVFVGAYEQNEDETESCMPAMKKTNFSGPGKAGEAESVAAKYAANVRVKTVPASDAAGPCKARHECSLLMRDEQVFLQIDSHTNFAEDWDVSAVKMLQELPGAQNGSVVISTYPVDCSDNWTESDPPVINNAKFSGSQIIFGATIRGDARTRDVPSRQIGGGFLLCVADVVRRVPLDPGLDGVFVGEEYLYTARLYTNGVDVVAPRRNLVCHRYTPENNPDHRTVWADNPKWADGAKGPARVDSLLRGKNTDQFGPFGIGSVRSLPDFWGHVQLDYESKTVGNWSH